MGFLFILVLIVVVIITGMTQMSSINQRVDRLVNHDAIKVALVHEMMDSVNERTVSMHVLSLMTDPFDQDDEYMKLSSLGTKFLDARDKLMKMQLSAEEQDILEQVRKLASQNRPVLQQVLDLATSGNNQAAQSLIIEKVAPLQRDVVQKLKELLRIQQRKAQDAVVLADSTYHKSQMLMGVLGVAAALLGLGIAVIVVRITNQQGNLLQRQALYDGLTGLPNRCLFTDRLQHTIQVYRREAMSFGLIAMDLNMFKEINDTLGHQVGDEVLKIVAQTVCQCLRESDTVARMGGDEFFILLPSAQTLAGSVTVAERILEKLRQPVSIQGHELEISASLGIAQYPDHAQRLADLQRQADMAMYQAKRGHTGYAIYDASLDQKADDRLELQAALRRALKNGELVLHYQPKIEFSTHRISGVEALVRWQHPTLGLLLPEKFVPLAEESELIWPLTESVLRMAIKQATIWLHKGLRLTVAVNVSAINVQGENFAEMVEQILREHQLPAELLELELTERAVLSDPKLAIECIRQLHEMGVQVSIDDFGTGYTTMSQLKNMLVARIKIDRSLVKNMVMSHNDAVIVRTAVDLGHNLGFKVVAEGVENQKTWDQLEALGCDSAQGFHMGKPLTPEVFIEWLNSSPWGKAEDKGVA